MRNRSPFLIDLSLLAPQPFVAMTLRTESFDWSPSISEAVHTYAALALPIRLGVANSVGIYRFLWRHVSLVKIEHLIVV